MSLIKDRGLSDRVSALPRTRALNRHCRWPRRTSRRASTQLMDKKRIVTVNSQP